MGQTLSRRLFFRRQSTQFFTRRGNPLTVVSEGEEVVWTNFETPDRDKDFRYEVPVRTNGTSEGAVNGSASKVPANTTGRKQSVPTEDACKKQGQRRASAVVEITVSVVDNGSSKPNDESKVEPKQESVATSAEAVAPEPCMVKPGAIQDVKREEKSQAEGNVKVTSQLITSSDEEICVISLNLLSDWNLTNSVNNPDDGRYKHAVPLATWDSRWPRLKEWFREQSKFADVFALQEVDFVRYQQDLKSFLLELGFEGSHQWDEDFAKKGAPNHPFGLATFHRKAKLKEAFKEARSRTFIIGLSLLSKATATQEDKKDEPKPAKKKGHPNKRAPVNCDWFIVNVHLDANPGKSEKRLGQLSSALFNLSTHAKINPLLARVVVLGDFNSLRDEPPVQWLLNKYKPGDAPDDGAGEDLPPNGPVDEDDKQNDKMVHAFNFEEAYGGADEATLNAVTYADPFAAARVDHLLVTKDTAETLAVLSIPPLSPAAKQFGIFGEGFPTDHFPVGCVLKAIPVRIPEPDEEENHEDDPNYCPLTEGQMRVLVFLENGAPKRSNRSGKPSPAEIAAMKSHTERVNAFISHFTPKQKAWVNKWRKQYKAPKAEEKEIEVPFKDRFKRSKSFAAPQEVINLSILFGEEQPSKEEIKSSFIKFSEAMKSSKPSPSPSPEGRSSPIKFSSATTTETATKAKRRQTVHGPKKTTFV